ncbi:hypothetical protein B0T20DRAFT_119319 [Sordaria brevicollis]|uniref:Uncharacterized protein n=1 Tax=Sordaria brevicollis TaxID=83679 RepID=A0AAE0PKN4_SORBR|nr:hypothetical protein B0T20DRAFT_119319 [Sordaria brevicollis]
MTRIARYRTVQLNLIKVRPLLRARAPLFAYDMSDGCSAFLNHSIATSCFTSHVSMYPYQFQPRPTETHPSAMLQVDFMLSVVSQPPTSPGEPGIDCATRPPQRASSLPEHLDLSGEKHLVGGQDTKAELGKGGQRWANLLGVGEICHHYIPSCRLLGWTWTLSYCCLSHHSSHGSFFLATIYLGWRIAYSPTFRMSQSLLAMYHIAHIFS